SAGAGGTCVTMRRSILVRGGRARTPQARAAPPPMTSAPRAPIARPAQPTNRPPLGVEPSQTTAPNATTPPPTSRPAPRLRGGLGQRVERDAAVTDEDQGGEFEGHAGRHRGGQDGDAPADGGQAQGPGPRTRTSRRDQAADDRAGAHNRGHHPVGGGSAVEHV